jgi:hypothetical protein
LSKLAAFVLAAMALWGCASESDEAKEAGGCPSGAALADAATVTKLRPGGGKDPTDVVMTAELAKPEIACDYDKDSGKVDVSLSFPITARRGPADKGEAQTFSYFVAIVDLDNTVVSKQTFTRDIALDQNVAAFNESPATISFTVGKDKKPVGYEALVGFQLSQDELAYNREKHRYIP